MSDRDPDERGAPAAAPDERGATGAPPDRLDVMLADIRAFVRERAWEPFHDPKNLAMAVASEAGELLSELRWVAGAESDAHCADGEARARVADEVADVAITLLMLADRIGLDLPAAVHAKLEKNRAKYPIDEWYGR